MENDQQESGELWGDIRTAPKEFLVEAFEQQLHEIAAQLLQLATDIESVNENRFKDNPIGIEFMLTASSGTKRLLAAFPKA